CRDAIPGAAAEPLLDPRRAAGVSSGPAPASDDGRRQIALWQPAHLDRHPGPRGAGEPARAELLLSLGPRARDEAQRHGRGLVPGSAVQRPAAVLLWLHAVH